MRVAYLASRDVLPQQGDRRQDAFEVDLQWSALGPECRALGIELVLVAWDDPCWSPEDFDAITVGPAWDYTGRVDAFLARLEQAATHSPVLNPVPTLRWNAHKTYLRDLEREGVPTIPTLWVDRLQVQGLQAAFDQLDCDTVVVKAVVGAGAHGQLRLTRGEPLPPLPAAAVMVQPFLPAITSEGEISVVVIDRQISHVCRKRPRPGDYRVQSLYGGFEVVQALTDEVEEVVQRTLQQVADPLLLARVDLVRGLDGRLCLIELELIEPYLYPEQGPELGARFARGLRRLVGSPGLAGPEGAG